MIQFVKTLSAGFSSLISKMKSSKRNATIFTVAAVIMTLLVTLTITAFAAPRNIKVTVKQEDAEPIVISTDAEDLTQFVEEEQETLKLEKGAYIDPEDFNSEEDCTLEVVKPTPIRFCDEGEIYYLNVAGTIEDALEAHGKKLGKFDETNIDRGEMVEYGTNINIERSFCVSFTEKGKKHEDVPMASGTVADALKKAGIALDGDDEVKPSLNTELTADTNIRIYRVEYKKRSEVRAVKFKTNTVVTSDLYIDQKEVKREGKDGESEFTYSDRYVDGEFVSSKLVNERVIKPVVDKKIFKGRVPRVGKIKLKAGLKPISELKAPSKLKLGADGLPVNYKRVVDGTAKAYSGGWGTASGRKPMPGHIAVDPKQFPYGTELYIVSMDGKHVYGYCIAADTGLFVDMEACTVDLYMNTYEETCRWGHKPVRIYVL